jgi:geranylgeranyl pyrophosphate synthase
MTALLLLEALGTPSEPYHVLLSCLAELPHTGALIIDDIEDESTTRRGGQCIHLRYGRDVAINAANVAYFLPLVLLADHPDLSGEQKLAIHAAFARELVHAHFGQSHDISWSRRTTPEALAALATDTTSARILRAYELKTGAAVAGPAAGACVIARADAATTVAVDRFARAFGTAFQIVDDILDYVDAEDRRKPLGKDISEGKLTYVLCRSLEILDRGQRSRLAEIVGSPDLRADPAAHAEAMDLVLGSGALAVCRDEAFAGFEDAWAGLAERLAPSEPLAVLRGLSMRLLHAAEPS